MELERAKAIAEQVKALLEPACEKVAIAGSLRRRRPLVNDIDLVLVPRDRYAVDGILTRLGKVKMSGLKLTRVEMDSISLDVYYATPETFPTLLLIRTGSVENNIRLCTLAKKKDWHLAANGNGLFDEKGRRIAGDSERSIYETLGLPYKEPWERG
jgi:DNA polymerase (family 10)